MSFSANNHQIFIFLFFLEGEGGATFLLSDISSYFQAQKQKLKFWQRFRIFISCLHEIGTSLGRRLFREVENKRECSDCPYLRKIY